MQVIPRILQQRPRNFNWSNSQKRLVFSPAHVSHALEYQSLFGSLSPKSSPLKACRPIFPNCSLDQETCFGRRRKLSLVIAPHGNDTKITETSTSWPTARR